MTRSSDTGSTSNKKPYEKPTLVEYGALADLTAGGTGNANEGSPGSSPKRP